MRLMRHKGGESSHIPPNYRRIPPQDRMNSQNLSDWLENEMNEWKETYDDFLESSRVIMRIQPDRSRYDFPSWHEVKEILPEVFSNTKLRVVNSDDLSADLNFSLEQMQMG